MGSRPWALGLAIHTPCIVEYKWDNANSVSHSFSSHMGAGGQYFHLESWHVTTSEDSTKILNPMTICIFSGYICLIEPEMQSFLATVKEEALFLIERLAKSEIGTAI